MNLNLKYFKIKVIKGTPTPRWRVANILTVLKKKYVDNVFDKYKARWVYDGRWQKQANTSLDTFAPTVRHSTHKLLCARACVNGAAPTTLSSKAYIERICAELLPKPLSEYSPVRSPCSHDLTEKYERAVEQRGNVCPTLRESYPRKVGKLVYAMPASRVDCAFAIGMFTRCLTFPTAEMDREVDRCLVYLGQHADEGVTYDGQCEHPGLWACCDSDWRVTNSTTGFCIFYGGAVVSYGSKRQQCIATSSTDAEIMAASHTALEIMYVRGLLQEMGADISEPTTLWVDNSGAVALSKDLKSCQRSRHIERRYLKVRELVAQGHIVVKYIPTESNVSDALTKPLPPHLHAAHAAAMMNITPAGPRTDPSPRLRQRTFDVEAAYLKGNFTETEKLYARPPAWPKGYRTYVKGDVPVVWRLKVPLYGEADAGRIWNRTLVHQLVSVQKFEQSEYDPCYFWKTLTDGTRMDLVMYVDDGYVVDAHSDAADAELRRLNDAFKIDIKPAHFFLGNNIVVHDGAVAGAP